MMANPFDQFDEAPAKAARVNPFDQFDAPVEPAEMVKPTSAQELTLGERLVSALPRGMQDWLANPSAAGVGLGKGSAVHGAMMGAADPVAGAVQIAANLPGISQTLTPDRKLSDLVTGAAPGNPVNQAIDAKSAEYEAARKAAGRDGFDVARLAGNIASPANVVVAQIAPINAASTLGKVAQGARAGAIGAAAAPVTDADQSFLPEKVLQAGVGAAGGAVLTPAASKAGEAIMRRIGRPDPAVVDELMREGVNRLRQEGITMPPAQIAQMRLQVMDALNNGVKLDVAAAMRKGDFEALGMQPTLGQITRDAAQFSREKNLRGVAGVGDPLMARFDQQARKLQELVTGQAAGAADDFTAGANMAKALKNVDGQMNAKVGAAYDRARDHLGRAAPMDSAAFSQAANFALDEQMLGSSLPREARKILNDVTGGRVPLNVNSAVLIDRRLSELQRDATRQGKGSAATAIGAIRDALNKAPIADNVGEDAKAAFDAARGVARQRFQTHELIPALKAAADGDIAADDFVRRYLINGKAEEVARLAKVMPPEMQAEARRQFGATLERAAFGANAAGDKSFAQESFNRLLNAPGMRQKLSAFFSPTEVEQLDRIGRVGAYIGSFPANSTVNTSNSAAALANLITRVPGVPQSLGLLGAAKNAATQQMAVNSALAGNPASKPTGITPEQTKLLARILGGGVAGVAGAAGAGVGN